MRILKRIITCGLTAVVLLSTAGCMYMHVQTPLDSDFDSTRLGTKEGRSSAYSLLWLVAWGDAGTKAAARDGDIEVIQHADTETTLMLLGLYTRITTVVYGD